MADPTGTTKLNPLETLQAASEPLQAASKLSLQGGGLLLFTAAVAVYQMNTEPRWQIDNWLIFTLLIGAVLLGLAGTVARIYDAKLRVQLALKLMEAKELSGAELKRIKEEVLGNPIVRYAFTQDGDKGLSDAELEERLMPLLKGVIKIRSDVHQ